MWVILRLERVVLFLGVICEGLMEWKMRFGWMICDGEDVG